MNIAVTFLACVMVVIQVLVVVPVQSPPQPAKVASGVEGVAVRVMLVPLANVHVAVVQVLSQVFNPVGLLHH